jgi:hypothetical protein
MSGVDSKQAGLWVPPGAPFVYQASVGVTANRGYVVRFPAPRSMSITKIAFFVVTAASLDDPCDVAIYDSASPLNRLGSSGSVSGLLNSTGLKQPALSAPVALVAGQIYYAAFGAGPIGGTAAQLQMTMAANSIIFQLFGASAPLIEQSWAAAGFPLPATFGTQGVITSAPILALLQ